MKYYRFILDGDSDHVEYVRSKHPATNSGLTEITREEFMANAPAEVSSAVKDAELLGL